MPIHGGCALPWLDEDPEVEAARERHRQSQANGNAEANGDASDDFPKRRFPLTRFADIKPNGRRRYIVKNLIPRDGLIVVWGPPKCGKSFLVSDIALHVSLGWDYRGRRVEPGTVVYITCEGQSGFPARIEAFRSHRLDGNVAEPPFYLLPTRLDLVGDIGALIADIEAQLGGIGPILIVIDTLNRSLAGSESKDEDMSAYVQACDRIRLRFNCAVLVIHHCGTNEQRPRGHTSLTGAADAQIAVKRDKSGNIVATVEYMKDGPEGDELASRLVPVSDIGVDEDGEPITSCLVEPVKQGEIHKARKPPTGQAGIAFQQLQNAIAKEGAKPPDNINFPTARMVVSLDVWKSYCERGGLIEKGGDDAFKKAWQRVRNSLLTEGHIGIWDGSVWIVEAENGGQNSCEF